MLNAADYTAQSDVLENKITELRIERRAKITDSDENEMLEELKMLNDILKEVEIGIGFDAELFEQTVDSITVESNERLTFHLAGGISLPEKTVRKDGATDNETTNRTAWLCLKRRQHNHQRS